MNIHKKVLSASWKTSILGLICILRGLWLFKIQWVPNQTFGFNFNYATLAAQLFLIVGVALWLARDNNVSSEEAGCNHKPNMKLILLAFVLVWTFTLPMGAQERIVRDATNVLNAATNDTFDVIAAKPSFTTLMNIPLQRGVSVRINGITTISVPGYNIHWSDSQKLSASRRLTNRTMRFYLPKPNGVILATTK